MKTFVLLKESLFDLHKERRPGRVYFPDEDELPHLRVLSRRGCNSLGESADAQLCPFRRLSRGGSPFVSSCMRRVSGGVCPGRCCSAIR